MSSLSNESRQSARLQRESDAVVAQISAVDEWARTLASTSDRFIYFTGLIAIGTVTYGIVQRHDLIVVLSFYALAAALTYQIQLYTDIEGYTAQREELEQQWNDSFGAKVYKREATLGHRYRTRKSVFLLALLNLAPLITFAFYGPAVASKIRGVPWYVVALDIAGTVVGLIIVLIAANENQLIKYDVSQAFGRAYPLSRLQRLGRRLLRRQP